VFLAITGALLFDFAYFREQTCLVVCPYGRFQAVLLDADSLLVGYDAGRGEPRGKPKDPNAGDCVDCKACVRVCPTGIDIRKGTQMECIQCMACVDACDDIMAKLKRPSGLIRLDSERHLQGDTSQSFAKRALRPRVIVYGLGLIAVLSILVFAVGVRQPVGLDLHRMSGAPPYVSLGDGRVQNSLELRIQNRRSEARAFTVDLVDLGEADGTDLLVPGGELVVEGEATRQFPVFVLRAAELGGGDVTLRVHDDQGFTQDISIEFLAGSRGANGGGG
jgi:cytochrome c oxidase accessory protein FixG